MTKDLFLSLLQHKLEDGGMPKELVDKSISQFAEHFSGMSEKESADLIDKLGGEDTVAEQIISDYKNSTKDKPKSVERKEVSKRAPKKDVNDLLLDDEDVKKASGRADKFFDDDEKTVNKSAKKPLNVRDKKTQKSQKPLSAQKPAATKKGEVNSKFVIGLIIASPVLLLLALVIVGAFLALYSAVAVAVVLFSILLVLLTALGTAFAVIAVIYGVTQLTQMGGAGLYEMGIGVIAGGVTLFCGILMYNFIVRLAPYIFKKLFVLIKFVIGKIKQLYFFAKEACNKI